MAAILKVGLLTCLLFISIVHMSDPKGQDENISNWVSQYERVDVTVCKQSISTVFLASLTVTIDSLHVGVDFVRNSHANTPVTYVQDHFTKQFLHNNTADHDVGVYSGVVRRPCCGNKAVMKITTEGLDVFIHMPNDTYVLESASRWSIDKQSNNYVHEKLCELYSCVFYKGSDVKQTALLSAAAYVGSSYNSPSFLETNHRRSKRSISKTECSLYIVADHTFYEKAGHSSIANTISEMLFLISEANLIFRSTDFEGNGQGDNVGLKVTKINVFTDHTGYKMADKTDVGEYLDSFSEYDLSSYCLAMAFTSKDFAGGVIGLAWVASPNVYGSPGGICQGPIYNYGKIMHYNSALTTTHNDGKMFTKYQTALTVTHEFGHNFGSPHDDEGDTSCAPGGEYGNFIMYPASADEFKPNTDIFSPCSISHMYPVIRNKGHCLQESSEPACGNGIVEKDEECDCGTTLTCQELDPCCTPSDVGLADPDLPCTIRRSTGKECSFKTSSCCTETCGIVTALENKVCRYERGCSLQAQCNGVSADCPTESFRPDKYVCDSGRKTCLEGSCIGSICASVDLTPCNCPETDQCYECCSPNNTTCSSTWSEDKIARPTGATCGNGNGFCDGHGTCVLGDRKSSLDRFNQVFTDTGISGVRDWFGAYWYYVVGGVAAVAFLTAVFVYTCRGDTHTKAGAYLHGQFLRVSTEAEIQKRYLERRRKETKEVYRKKLVALDEESSPMQMTKALARLMMFFPTVPPEVLTQTLETSTCEETAVSWLLLRNYPFRRVNSPIESEDV